MFAAYRTVVVGLILDGKGDGEGSMKTNAPE
jgi:hypothetical protein